MDVVVDVDVDAEMGCGSYTAWLVRLELSPRDNTDCDGNAVKPESRGEVELDSVSLTGDVEGLPREPARAREMKLLRRSRFRTRGGDCWEKSFSQTGLVIGRPPSRCSVESMDQREAGVPVGGGHGKASDRSKCDDSEVAREAMEGWCATLRVGDVMLMGEAGMVARSASVQSCGEVDVARFRVGRDLRLGLPSNDVGNT